MRKVANFAVSHRSRGFSVIELVIGMAILSLLVGMGTPSLRQWIANAALRSVAESFTGGLHMARSEAMRRNTTVTFRYFDQGETLWEIVDGAGTRLHAAVRGTGSIASQATLRGFEGTGRSADWLKGVAFNGMGRASALSYGSDGNGVWDPTIVGETVSFLIDLPAVVLAPADSRDFRVEVQRWGAVRMCDPNLRAGLTQACATGS